MSRRYVTRGKLEIALGQVVRAERERRRWSQKQLADHADLSRTMVSLIELGKVAATISAVEKLALALDKQAHQLIKKAEDASRKS